MPTFVLVHGTWCGAWCWRRVARMLTQAGHEVFTPTVTGIGERSHLLKGLPHGVESAFVRPCSPSSRQRAFAMPLTSEKIWHRMRRLTPRGDEK